MGSGRELKPSKRRVLVVDDDPVVRWVLAELLEQEGFEVQAAQDGLTALAAFQADRFDLIFVDLQMPGMTGLEIAAAVRRTDRLIPIILVTAQASALEIIAVAQAGISRVLPKPFKLDDLIACLQ